MSAIEFVGNACHADPGVQDRRHVAAGAVVPVVLAGGAGTRLENPGRLPLEIIEVQTGSDLGEDDIVRFDDAYGRV
jgi:hypothetical protein